MDPEDKYVPKLYSQCYNGYQAQCVAAKDLPSEGFSIKYDPQDEFIAIVCGNGHKILYSKGKDANQAQVPCPDQYPSTCVKWRPMGSSTSKMLGVSNADGHFDYWHVPSMRKIFNIKEKQNSIHCFDFSKTGDHFATAGKDCNIRIYDENTKTVSTTLGAAEWNHRGHSNRIFSVKFIDDNTIISGGWDSVIHIWDVRQAKSIKSFFGPHVAGDSIDVQDNSILIGCYASKDQLQFWDLKKFQQTEAITWVSSDKEKVAYVYTACFSPYNKGLVLAGACGVNEVKLFEKGSNSKYQVAVKLSQLKHGCFSVDLSWKSNQLAFSTAHHAFYRYSFAKK